jgi:hypothetical protein
MNNKILKTESTPNNIHPKKRKEKKRPKKKKKKKKKNTPNNSLTTKVKQNLTISTMYDT